MKAILSLVLVCMGIAGGGALGVALRPPPPEAPAGASDGSGAAAETPADPEAPAEYVKLGRKLVVPVLEGAKTRALMVFDLGVDAPQAAADRVHALKPRLRDAFLSTLFQMAATGAFDESYTDAHIMAELRTKLLEAAREQVGPEIREVLILDAIRKEL